MKLIRRYWIAGIALALAGIGSPADADMVERELGTDSRGNAVKGHVFQAGRGFSRSSSRRSSLPVRRVSRRPVSSRRIHTGYYSSFLYVPYGPFCYGSPFASWGVPVRHIGGASFSVRVYR